MAVDRFTMFKQGWEVWHWYQGSRKEWRPSGEGCIVSGQSNLDTVSTLKVTDPNWEMCGEFLVCLVMAGCVERKLSESADQ